MNSFLKFILGVTLYCAPLVAGLALYDLRGSGLSLGDDTLTYQWKIQYVAHGYRTTAELEPHARLVMDARSGNSSPLEAEKVRSRIRVFGSYSPLYDAFMNVLFGSIDNFRTRTLSVDLATAILCGAGLYGGLALLFGTRVALLSVALLSGFMAPNQGLHYMIPGVLALSGFVLLLGLLHRRRVAAAAVTALLLPWLHPIGQLYVALSAFFWGLRASPSRATAPHVAAKAALFLLASIFPYHLLQKFLPNVFAPVKSEFGHLPDFQSFVLNLKASAVFVRELIASNPILFLCSLISLVSIRWIRSSPTLSSSLRPLTPLLGVLLLALAGSTLHVVELGRGPGELFSRLLVAWAIIGLAAPCAFGILKVLENSRGAAAMAALLIVLAICGINLRHKSRSVVENLNGRIEHNDVDGLRSAFDKLSLSKVFALNMDIGFMGSLLAADRPLELVPVPLLDLAEPRLQSPSPTAACLMLSSGNLNSLARLRSSALLPRKQGFLISNELESKLTVSGAKSFAFILKDYSDGYGWDYSRMEIARAPPAQNQEIVISPEEKPFWVRGIRFSSEDFSEQRWPWDEGVTLNYTSREGSLSESFELKGPLRRLRCPIQFERPRIFDPEGYVLVREAAQ